MYDPPLRSGAIRPFLDAGRGDGGNGVSDPCRGHLAPYCTARVQALRDGAWTTGSVWWGMKEGMMVIPPYGPGVTPPAAAEADRVKAGIIAGTLHPFAGPVRDQKGTARVAEGAAISDEDLLKMNWYVEGVQA